MVQLEGRGGNATPWFKGAQREALTWSHTAQGQQSPEFPDAQVSGFGREGGSGARGRGGPASSVLCAVGEGECCLPAPPVGPLHLEWQSCQQDNWHFCGCDW